MSKEHKAETKDASYNPKNSIRKIDKAMARLKAQMMNADALGLPLQL